MGANTFMMVAEGKTAKQAFEAAVADAKHDYGHAGYTGTIAEKRTFVLVTPPAGADPRAYANKLIDDGDRRIDDKWGPAGVIALGDGKWLFFGWASS